MRGKGLCLGCSSAEEPFMGSHVSFIFILPNAKSLPSQDPRSPTWCPLPVSSPALHMLKGVAAACCHFSGSSPCVLHARELLNAWRDGARPGPLGVHRPALMPSLSISMWYGTATAHPTPYRGHWAEPTASKPPLGRNPRCSSPHLFHEQTVWGAGVQVTLAWGRQHVGIVMQPLLLRTCAHGIECLLSYTWVNKPFLSENKHL